MAGQQAELGQHRPSVPGGPKQTLLPEEAAIIQRLQETPKRLMKAGQADQVGRLCGRQEAGISGDSSGEENIQQTSVC